MIHPAILRLFDRMIPMPFFHVVIMKGCILTFVTHFTLAKTLGSRPHGHHLHIGVCREMIQNVTRVTWL